MGSTKTAQIFLSFFAIVFMASKLLKGTLRNPSRSGSNPAFTFVAEEALIAA